MKNLNWKQLENFKCPMCESKLVTGDEIYLCFKNPVCKFVIKASRFNVIIEDMMTPKKIKSYVDPYRSDWD